MLSDGHERVAGCGVNLARDQIGISAAGAGRFLHGVAGGERARPKLNPAIRK